MLPALSEALLEPRRGRVGPSVLREACNRLCSLQGAPGPLPGRAGGATASDVHLRRISVSVLSGVPRGHSSAHLAH